MLDKLKRQITPTIVISDFDGTLFSPDIKIVTAPFYNRQTAALLRTQSIPFIIATGRSDWQQIDKQQLALAGLPRPDAVITANGTIIYYHTGNNNYERDFEWETTMHYSKLTRQDGTQETWNKLAITHTITEYLRDKHMQFQLASGNTFLIRIKVSKIPVTLLQEIRKDILALYPSGVRFIITEKLLWENTLSIFSGDILIVPTLAGKDMAVKYLLEKLAKELQLNSSIPHTPHPIPRPLHALVFADATVDVGMLTMKGNPKLYHLSQYGIHLTPLARQALEKARKTNPNIHILENNGPKEILRVLQEEVINNFSSSERSTSRSIDTGSRLRSNNTSPVIVSTQQPHFSPAQNNSARQLLKKLEPLLNRIVDARLSPNEVSFLGLTKLQESLKNLQTADGSVTKKLKGLYSYGFANLTDVLDGIRARQSGKKEANGPLIDGFCDRAKEFMQLFHGAKQRLAISVKREEDSPVIASRAKQSQPITHNSSLITFLAALSCALPSIAREQVEITGNVVPERDSQGGSMIDRTKKLFFSLLMDTNGAHAKSLGIDQEIYYSNIATFKNRLHIFSSVTKKAPRKSVGEFIASIQYDSFSDFQKTGLEKFLLYVDVLQQEDAIIKKYLSKNPHLLKEYEKASLKLAKDYLELPIARLRKKWKIPDYKLKIKKYI